MTVARVMRTLIVIVCAAALLSVASAAAAAAAAQCPSPCECFTSDNGVLAANCTGLPDQTAVAWPQKNLRIRLGASPVVLKNRAFANFPRLAYLDVADATVQYVGSAAFDGLPELLELNLVGAGVRRLHRDTVAGNRKLAFLSLRNNPRLAVGPSFLVSDSVTELDLSECGLTSLKSVYFAGLTGLKYLFAAGNHLKALGPQFGPPGLKYVNLARNRIETVRDDLDAYKRLRTVDLTGNPVNCTCELSEVDRRLTARGVAFGDTVTCNNTGRPLADMAEVCADGDMMGDEPADMYKADGLLKIDQKQWQSMEENDDFGSGSGSGDDELPPVVVSTSPALEATVATVASTAENYTPPAAVTEPTSTVQPSSSERPADVVGVVSGEEEEEEEEEEVEISGEKSDASSEEKTTDETTTTSTTTIITTSTTESVVVVHVEPTVQTSDGGNATSTARSGMDGGIVPLTIQAPEDGNAAGGDDDVQTKVAEYLKTNVGITGTAVLLAVVIVAIVYKAVCMGKKMSRGGGDAAVNEKSVELKEIKYIPANTEDSRDGHRHIDSPSDGSVEENRLLDGDRESDDGDGDGDDDDDDDDDEDGGNAGHDRADAATDNGRAQNGGLLNSVMDAVKSGTGNGRSADAPTRVVVKLGETPKTSKPVAIDNVQ